MAGRRRARQRQRRPDHLGRLLPDNRRHPRRRGTPRRHRRPEPSARARRKRRARPRHALLPLPALPPPRLHAGRRHPPWRPQADRVVRGHDRRRRPRGQSLQPGEGPRRNDRPRRRETRTRRQPPPATRRLAPGDRRRRNDDQPRLRESPPRLALRRRARRRRAVTTLSRRDALLAALGLAAARALPAQQPQQPGPLEKTFEDAKPLNLRITDLKTFLVDAGNDENFVFVKLYTNQGITGLGEGTLANKGEVVAAAIENHKRYLVGKDPTEIERHWRGMFIGPRYRGGPVLMSALSAVEIAMWDILGQALGQPIWQLLGGKARDRVRLYCHEGYLERISHRQKRRAADYEEELDLWRQKKEAGWTCVKGGFYPGGRTINHRVSIRRGVEHLARVREIVGPDFDIIVEAHGKPTPLSAVEFCNRVEEYRPFWVEEVTQLENEVIEEVRQIRAQTRVPLATGERLTSRYHFAPLCSERLVDVIMPDVVHVGGISELRKIAIMAEGFRVDVSPHNPQSEVSTLASMHVCACTPNCTILEIGSGQDPFWQDLFHGGHFSYERGFAKLPSRPGLGIDLDEEVAAKFPYEPKTWSTLTTEDGAFVDR
ncbi:MAG: hypothetical protein F4156_14790 [Holophagales bacterium]|nr:hypothetical protein [Holophagales bacterium]